MSVEIKNINKNEIGKCWGLFHDERYGTDPVELIGYCWFNCQAWNERLKTYEPNHEKEKLDYCQKCYDYNLPFMIEKGYYKRKRAGIPFTPQKWFWFYEDDEKKQAEENGKQLDYYYQQLAPYHKEIILLKDKDFELGGHNAWIRKDEFNEHHGDKGMIIDLYIGNFGTRYCISCSTKKNDKSDKKLVMSLDNAKLCYSCGIKKASGLVDGSNPNLTLKVRMRKSNKEQGTNSQWWETLDKEDFSNELQKQLVSIEYGRQ